MTAHTKGPWIYINDWPDMRIESADGKYLIADYDTSFIEYPGDDETEANARLIASAPELLEELESAFRLLDAIAALDFPDAMSRIERVIAKAKGESDGR